MVCYFNTHRNGWGCMVHHAAYCLMAALASNRMLIIDKTDEVFGLGYHFLPVSQKCSHLKIPATPFDWPTKTDEEKIVKFCPNRLSKTQDVYLGRFNTSMVPYLPKDLIDLLTWVSPDPIAWFVGQFMKYLLRPKPWFQKELNVLKKLHPGKIQGWNFSLIFNVPRGECQCFQSIPVDGSAWFFLELKTLVQTENLTPVIVLRKRLHSH